MAEALMQLRSVGKTFVVGRGPVRAVDAFDLEIRTGHVTCLVGESGSGKTTAARIAAGLTSPSSGEVLFEGREVSSLSAADRGRFRLAVQYVHQDPYASLNPMRTIQGALTAPLIRNRLVRGGRGDAVQRAAELLRAVDLNPPENYLGKFPHQLSGGQRQRASIARALATDPRLIIADEATSMLDVSIRISMLNLLARLRDTMGVGFLFITHDLAQAKYFGWDGDLAVMYLGRVVERGPTQELIARPAHPYTRALLAAVPEPDPDRTRAKRTAALRKADVPSMLSIPAGCPFHPRCPMYRAATCDTARPELLPASEGGAAEHRAACFRMESVAEEMPLEAMTDGGVG